MTRAALVMALEPERPETCRFWRRLADGALAVVLPPPLSVDCRIQVGDDGDVRTIVIVGRMLGEHVPGLLAACGGAVHLRVNLADMLSVDVIAADALRRIRDAGAQFVGVPPYIQFKLDSVSCRPPGS